jgi:hypothetical protein
MANPFDSIRPHREEDGTLSYVALRDGFEAPRRFVAKNANLALDIELEPDGTPHVRAVLVIGEHVTSDKLRLPLVRLTREAVAGAARLRTPLEEGGEPVFRLVSTPPEQAAEFYREYTQDARRPRSGSPVTDEHLRQVAELYRAALKQGDPPTQTIANALHVARSTAARWVAAARGRGLLGAATPGRAGERPMTAKKGR